MRGAALCGLLVLSLAGVAAQAPTQGATCTLKVLGQRTGLPQLIQGQQRIQAVHITYASLSCTGGPVHLAINETLLGKFKANFKGAIMDERQCDPVNLKEPSGSFRRQRCLITVCKGTHATFKDSIIKDIEAMIFLRSYASMDNATATATVGLRSLDGLLCVVGRSNVAIVDTTMASNVGPHSLLVADSTVTLANSSVRYNNASGYSGAVLVASNSSMSITGSTSITHNVGSKGAGIYIAPNSTVRITDAVSITHNVVSDGQPHEQGGGVFVAPNSTLLIAGGAVVSHNHATSGQGGGIYGAVNSTVRIGGHASVVRNQAVAGGAVAMDANSLLQVLDNALIAFNNATMGGAILVLGGTKALGTAISAVTVAGNASITRNNASSYGGGVAAINCAVTLADRSSLTHNSAGEIGGGIAMKGKGNIIVGGRASISHNNATSGGGVGVSPGVVNVTIGGSATISHNAANADPGFGGGVYVVGVSNVTILDSAFVTFNTASGSGGGVSVWGMANVTVAGNASISHNKNGVKALAQIQVIPQGGGLAVGGRSNVSIIDNVIITHNNGTGNGGGVFIEGASNVIVRDNVRINDNTAMAGGAVYLQGDTSGMTTLSLGADALPYGNAQYVKVGNHRALNWIVNASITHNVLLLRNKAGNGGAIYLGVQSGASFSDNASIMHNMGLVGHGGGMFVGSNSSLSINDNATCSQNQARVHGDDIYAGLGARLKFSGTGATPNTRLYWERSECEVGEVKTDSLRICTPCERNVYSLNPHKAACDPCPPHANCTGRDVLLPLEGWYHSHQYSTQMHMCPKPAACNANGSCSYGYSGPLCGNCNVSLGYGMVGAFTCGPCKSVGATAAVYVISWLLLVVLVAWLVNTTIHDNLQCTRVVRPSDVAKVLLRHVQYLVILCAIRLPWPRTLSHMFNAVAWVFSASTAQIVSLDCVLHAVHTSVPTAVAKTLISLLMPVTILVAVLMLRLLMHSWKSRTCSLWTAPELVVSVLVVLFFFYPMLVQTSLGMFACVPVDNARLTSDPYPQYAIANASRGYWVWDMQQPCAEGWHLRWSMGLGLPCVLFFCLGVPLSMWLVLHRNQAKPLVEETSINPYVGFLYHCFTPHRYYWEAVASLQSVFLVLVGTFSFSIGSFHAVLLMHVCFLSILAAHYIFQPLAFRQVQHIQLASSACLLLTTLIGMSFFEGGVTVPAAYKEVAGVVGLVCNMAFMCWCVWVVGVLGKGQVVKWATAAAVWVKGRCGRRAGRRSRRPSSR